MSTFNIEVEGGKSVKLPTAGKYCDRDIIVTAKGGGGSGGDYQQGYEDGYTTGHSEGYVAGETKGFGNGREYENENFWGNFHYSSGGDYQYAFANPGWTDENYNPVGTIVCTVSAENMYGTSAKKSAKVTSTVADIEVRGCSASNMIAYNSALKTVPYIKFDGVTKNSSFAVGCTALEDITFDGEITMGIGFASSSKLTNTSAQSIIDHLADLTGQTAQKVTFHNDVGSKLTEAQKAAITAKNRTLAY